MSIIIEKFAILKNPATGFLVLIIGLCGVLTVASFQETVELPKMIVWFIGFGILILISLFKYRNQIIFFPKILVYLSLPFIVFLLAGVAFSFDPINSLLGVYPRYIASALFVLSLWLFILLFSLYSIRDKKDILITFSLTAWLVALWGISQGFGFGYYGGLYEGVRSSIPSFLGNPNFSSMFVVVTLPIVLWLLATAKSRIMAIFYFGVLGTNLVSLMIFNSRGAMLGFLFASLSGITALAYGRRYKLAVFVAGLIVTMGLGMWSYYQVTRVDVPQIETDTSSRSVDSRWLIWDIAFDQIGKHPLVGHGLGNYFLAFRASQNPALSNTEWFDDAHNAFLQLAADAGLPVAISVIIVAIAAFVLLSKRFLYNKDLFAGAVALALITWMIVGSFTPVSLPNWLLLAALIGIGLGYTSKTIGVRIRLKISVVAAIIATAFITIGLLVLFSEVLLWQAKLSLGAKYYQQAEDWANASVAVFPYNTNARLVLVKSQVELGKYEDVRNNLINFQNMHPFSSGLYQSIADYYVDMYLRTNSTQFKVDAIVATENMIDYNRNYEPARRVAVLNMLRLGELLKANRYARDSVVMDMDNNNSWLFLAKTAYELDDRKTTLFALDRAFKISPSRRLQSMIDLMSKSKNIQDVEFYDDL